MTASRRILHLQASFDLGGKEARSVRLMNAFGDAASHVVLSAETDALGAREAIDPAIAVDFPGEAAAPALHGIPGPGRYIDLARYMARFDLVLSYNWGSMDGVMAHRLASPFMALPPLIHHEDGFNEDEQDRRKWKRDAFRRVALTTARHVMVPSRTLLDVARTAWGCREPRLVKFDNGIRLADYDAPSVPRPPLAKPDGAIWVGAIAGLRPVKDLPALVRAVKRAGNDAVHLVIAGEGPERGAIVAEAQRCGIQARVHLIGFQPHPADLVPHFDIFALSSKSEQQPIGLIEAMAAGLPAACYGVGDIADMVAADNARFIVAPDDEAQLASAIAVLAGDGALRERIGEANRKHAFAHFAEAAMVEHFRALYGAAMGVPDFARDNGGLIR